MAKNKKSKGLIMCGLLTLGVLTVVTSHPELVLAGEGEHTFKLAHIEKFEPFAVAKEGKSEGLAVDIITEALAKVNIRALFVGDQQDKLEGLLAKGEVDGWAFLGINPERRKTYDFSDPYLISGGALFVKSPNPPSSDLKEFEGKTVVTPKIGPLAGYIEKNFPKVRVMTDVKSYTETLQAVVDGKADAAALNTQAGSVLAGQLFPGRFSMPEKGFLDIPIGIGVLKGMHGDLLTRFNEGLKLILADGTYDRLLNKWGVPEATRPSQR
jgi:ABC-type amino acid transport substrate-binding protein